MEVRRFFMLIALSAAMSICFIACSDDDNPATPSTGTLAGTVTMAISGETIAGAEVRTDPETSIEITDEDGHYSFTGISPGDYAVTVTMSGYDESSETVAVSAGKTASVNFSLTVEGGSVPLVTEHWKCYSIFENAYVEPASGVYEQMTNGLKFYGSGVDSVARYGAGLHPDEYYNLENKTLFVEWNVHDNGNFTLIELSATPNSGYPLTDSGWRFSEKPFSTNQPFDGSILINADTFYFTRIEFSVDSYTAVTATEDFDSAGGSEIYTYTNSIDGINFQRKPLFRISENYEGTNVYLIIRKCTAE